MHSVHHTPVLTSTSLPPSQLDVDLVAVAAFEGDSVPGGADLDAAAGGEAGRARARGEFKGELYETLAVSTVAGGWVAPRALLVGLGPRADLVVDRLRRMGTAAGLAARARRLTRLAIVAPDSDLPADVVAQALAEGVVLANYDGSSYKTSGPSKAWLDVVIVACAGAEQALERGRVLGECTNVARALQNEPGNALTPRRFAERATEVAAAAGLLVEVLDEVGIASLKMGMLLGVAQGSAEPPRLIVLRHEPPDAMPGVVLGLVGKGITFDTGGISLKPAERMDRMKEDMSGGAAVLGAMAAIARLKAPVRCLGVIAASENMPGSRAIKPGDVITSAQGKTVEVINTDAEGRLVLGDALWYARKLGATHLVDIATLTGGCIVALGLTTAGLFGSPARWRDEVQRAGDRAGDRMWPMPDFDDFMEQLKSEIADFSNSGTRWGSASVGAVFVKEFSGGLPWVHLDIAGPAWAEEQKTYQAKGATGVGVRTLAELALAARTWGKL